MKTKTYFIVSPDTCNGALEKQICESFNEAEAWLKDFETGSYYGKGSGYIKEIDHNFTTLKNWRYLHGQLESGYDYQHNIPIVPKESN